MQKVTQTVWKATDEENHRSEYGMASGYLEQPRDGLHRARQSAVRCIRAFSKSNGTSKISTFGLPKFIAASTVTGASFGGIDESPCHRRIVKRLVHIMTRIPWGSSVWCVANLPNSKSAAGIK